MAATDFKDYYATLGIGKTANADEIKRAYRKLARQYHPDMNPGDKAAEARFKEVNEAYEVLSDPDKRQKYDQFGQYWKQAEGWSPGGAAPDFGGFDFSQYGSFDDFINELLGRFSSPSSGSNRYNYRPAPSGTGYGGFNDFPSGFENPAAVNLDFESSLSLTLAEAFHGAEKRLSIGDEVVTVRIPKGTKPGSRLRLKGKGQFSPYGQQRGDLYLKIELKPHPFFRFEGDNLVGEVPIAPDEAVLGGSIDVPTPDGMVKMNIPAGTRSGQTLRLRGKGWQTPKGDRGDQLVRVIIVPPKDLSSTEREYYEKIRATRSFDPRSHLRQTTL
ncbi:MAG: DnaJ domain-containing protein [Leptolyngbyaceae cyanobacterium SL_7_1]|nr:DnaJ domain-containing protein [Leptolyngbyaceae cyanobacterium SL_7_1]